MDGGGRDAKQGEIEDRDNMWLRCNVEASEREKQKVYTNNCAPTMMGIMTSTQLPQVHKFSVNNLWLAI